MRRRYRALSLLLLPALAYAPAARAQAAHAAEAPVKRALYRDGPTERYLLAGQWLLRRDPSDIGLAAGFWRDRADTSGWSTVSVPNAYNARDFSKASMNGYAAWYRRDFVLPAGAFARGVRPSARRWIVRFEAVNYRAEVWLNGRLIGRHDGGFVPFELDLKGLRPGANRLIVRVDNRRSPTDLPPGPGGNWFNYGGLVREVYVRPAARVDLGEVQVRPTLLCSACAATVDERVLLRNVTSSTQTVDLHGAYGGRRLAFSSVTVPPHSTRTARARLRIAHPRLWSIDHPKLYRATLTLRGSDGTRLAGYVTDSGIRRIKVAGGRLTLNGHALALRGLQFQESNAAVGGALDAAQREQMIAWVRQLGGHLIRTHYPLHPEFQELADRYGILVWSEVPVYQTRSQYVTDPSWVRRAHAALSEDIRANENHPSVLLWSVGNELQTPADGREARYVAVAAALARRLDPTRPVGMAVGAWPGVACQSAYAPLDVIGINEYFGWFDAGVGGTADRDQLGPFLDYERSCYRSKALMVTEFGFDGNRDGPVEEHGTYEFQADAVAFHLRVFAQRGWLAGADMLALQDFASRPDYTGGNPFPDPPWNRKGVVDLVGHFKPAFAVVAAAYHAVRQMAP
jgi:beta-glucuronidase